MNHRTRALLLALAAFLPASPAISEVGVTEMPDRVRVEIDGQLFTELRHADAPHLYYYPVIGPGRVSVTRSWPMESPPGEEHDHPHHRSLWYGHGLVNGVDFWLEQSATKPAGKHPIGKIVLDRVLEAKGGAKSGVVKTSQKWIAPDGSVPVTSVQTLRVFARPESERLFDFEIVLTAGATDVLFGDTKEGTFAMRIAESMRLKQPKGPGKGHILNSSGLRDEAAWGTRAKWVQMSGPIDGKVYGVAIFDHPSNPRHPTRWHARDYGLFAANPFCEVDMDKKQARGAGDFPLAAGQSVTFKYRILIFQGESNTAVLDAKFAEFARNSPE